jgi:hypothetical protein
MLSNILLDKLPEITPNGFKIKTDFRQAIKFELLMQDKQIEEKEKTVLALNLFYDDLVDAKKQIEDIIWFYLHGKEIEENKEEGKSSQQIYSYEYDADYIFAAFLETYGVDLNIENLHWWKFKAMFNSLSEKTKFVEIMGYRAIDLSKIQDKEERKRYEKLKEIYQLPDMRTEEEKEADFSEALW